MTKVRCKFACVSKREHKDYTGKVLYDYEFNAVIGNTPNASAENKLFWEWTPSGKLNVSCVKDGTFIVGAEYYLDLITVEATPVAE